MCGPRCVHLCGCAFRVHAFLCPALGVHVPMCFSLYARLCLSLHMCAQSYVCACVTTGGGTLWWWEELPPTSPAPTARRCVLAKEWASAARIYLLGGPGGPSRNLGSAASLPQNSPSWSNHWEAGYSHIRIKQWQPQFTCLKKQCSPGPRLSKILVCRWSGIVRAIHFFSPPPVSRRGMSIIEGPAIFTCLC